MQLDTKYWHALDKQAASNLGIEAKEIGMSHGMGDVLQGMKSQIFTGTHHVELGFTGKGKGQLGQGSTTPETFDSEVREDIRQLGKLNDVTVSTHATVAVTGLSGQTQQGNFSEEQREQSVHEVKRAIDFQADLGDGGPVVFHAGEFPRSIMGVPGKFEAYPGEEKRAMHYLVNKETGQIFQTIRENEDIWIPRKKKDKQGNVVYAKNPDGSIRYVKYPDNTEEPIPEYELDQEQNLIVDKMTLKEYREKVAKTPQEKREAPLNFFKETLTAEREHAIGQAEEYEIAYREGLKQREQIVDALREYDELKKHMREEDYWLLKRKFQQRYGITDEIQDVGDHLKGRMRDAEKRMAYGREIAVSSRKNAARLRRDMDRTVLMEEYGKEKSADSIARLGVYAYEKERQKNLEKPLFVAPENLFPEWGYGGHPQELKELVVKSRKEMADLLVKEKGMGEVEAKRIAEDHIKATFDVGHANMWRKFFKGDPSKSIEENDKEFKGWLLDEATKLQKEGIIGHVHLSDNFGYNDEHLTPGKGNVPIKEFVEKLKLHGYEGKFIAEPGAQPQGRIFEALTGSWKTLGSPIYRTDVVSQTWTDIEHSYFGQTRSPLYVVGDYAPDQKEWTLYSGVPLE